MIEGIERIKQKLATELAEKQAYLENKTAQQIAEIEAQAKAQIAEEQALEAKWRANFAEQEKKRLAANGNLERKRIRLEMNQQIIDELMYQLLQKLSRLPKAQKLALYTQILPKSAPKQATLIVAENDKELLEELLTNLAANDADWQSVKTNVSPNFLGGVKLAGEKISEDYSFEELLKHKNYELLQIIKQKVLNGAE